MKIAADAHALWSCSLLLLACDGSAPQAKQGRPQDASSPSDVIIDAATAPAVDPRCVAPEGISTLPTSIAETASLLNALPKPVSLPCFVTALARPLSLQAVDSVFSAQPAQGRRNPRVFLFFPGLTLSVVPAGPGAPLLELGEAREENQSLKAELEFPIEGELDDAAPYQRVHFDDAITTCGFCHQGERRAEDVASPLAFVSPALRPRDYQRVPLDELRAELAACDAGDAAPLRSADAVPVDAAADAAADAGAEPGRCALLQALFGQQPDPVEHEFPVGYKTFF